MKTFEELNISPEIRKAINEMGFENPMPVQEEVIPFMLGGKNDVIALAQTGTGKTAAFGLPLIQEADANNALPGALILAPTRELCIQITGDLTDYAKYCDKVKILPVYGGTSIETQIKALKSGVQIVVATPGRLLDLLERKAVKLKNITRVILDEADEMLNMGFLDDINAILAEVPEGRNTLLFSATMPNEIVGISKKYMNKPVEITIGVRNSGAENIKHVCYTVQAKNKYLALKRIADYNPAIYSIVFCRTRRETQEIADKLIADGYNADALHGDLSQAQRDSVMQKFRIRNVQLLVATDVAARGLDVDDLTHVINYSLPEDHNVYVHRSGRTGRTGKAGISVVIVNLKEKSQLKVIEKKIGKSFTHAEIPSGHEICEKQLFHFINRMEKVEINHSQIDTYLPSIFKKLEWLEKEEIITRFVSLEFNRLLEYYKKNSVNINVTEDSKADWKEKSKRDKFENSTGEGYARLFINLGKTDGFYPAELIQLINDHTRGLKVPIGRIDLMKNFSFFEVEEGYADEVLHSMKNITLDNRDIIVERASDKNSSQKDDRSSGNRRGNDNFGNHNRNERTGKHSFDDRKFRKKPRSENAEGSKKDETNDGESIFRRNKKLFRGEGASEMAQLRDSRSFFKKRKTESNDRRFKKSRVNKNKGKRRKTN
ncbi:MAG TPA: DEAD/DEAH box helicase [Bacteroidales bacterium]|nr:DEAD/DEAH box helicase [Bacteroidales bacterium]